VLQVGEVSQRLGLNPQTLYFYERIGLIPSLKRTEAGYRLYDESDLERLTFITQAKTLGLSLDDIKELLTLQDGHQLSCQDVYDRLLKKVQQIDQTIHQLQTLKAQLTPLLNQCQQGIKQSGGNQQCVVFQGNAMTQTASSFGDKPMTTLKVEILGSGCKKCQQLEANAKAAIAMLGMDAEVFHVTDIVEIAQRGVMSTPALVVDNRVVSRGQVLSPEQIQPLLAI